jgi:hypothetical protein
VLRALHRHRSWDGNPRCRATAASWLPPVLFLANYPASPNFVPHNRAFDGCSEKEDFALAPQHAAIASFFETRGLCRMPELRRAQAPASSVRIVRILRRA